MNDYLYEVASRLVAFDTVSTNSDLDAIQYIGAELRRHGFKTVLQPVELLGVSQANLVAWVGPPRADGLIISAHVDTVPYRRSAGMAAGAAQTRTPRGSEFTGAAPPT